MHAPRQLRLAGPPLVPGDAARVAGTRGAQQEAAAEEIQTRPSIRLALEHFEAIYVSLHGARTPGQGHPGFDRCIVAPQPLGKSPRRPQRTLRGALQPGIELCPLALADELGNVFCEGDGVRQFARLGAPLGDCWDSTAVRGSPRRSTSHAARVP